MSLPGWLGAFAALDDAALAALANPGLVRRGRAEVAGGRVALADAAEAEVKVSVGTPPMEVRLLPAGPKAARCPCPATGVCVHIVGACLWARDAAGPIVEDDARPGQSDAASEPGQPGVAAPAQADAATQPRVDVSFVRAGAPAPDAMSPNTRPSAAGAAAPLEPEAGRTSPVLAEVLTWSPAAVNRAVGIAAVRRVAAELAGRQPAAIAAGVTVEDAGARVTVRWPDSPDVVFLRGGTVAGLLVAGQHSDVAEAAWRLGAVVRVFALAGTPWLWPESIAGPSGALPAQTELVAAASAAIEELVGAGLSHAGDRAADALAALGHRARLEDLPLLAGRLRSASGVLGRLTKRADDTSEADALEALATAWALARALAAHVGPLPSELVGGRGPGEAAPVANLIPLAARWWTTPTSRGATIHYLDPDAGRLEAVTTGRAAGADPTFIRSAQTPALWNTSIENLTSGPLRIAGAERRDDGTLSPTGRTRVTRAGDFTDLDLGLLAERVDAARAAEASGFGLGRPSVRLVIPRLLGVGPLELDEVRQEVVWTLTSGGGVRHRLRLDAAGAEVEAIVRLLADRTPIAAVTVVDDRPDAIWLRTRLGLTLMLPSLTVTGWTTKKLDRRLDKLRAHARAAPDVGPQAPIAGLVADVAEVLTAQAASGRLSDRDRATLTQRAGQARDLGLDTLAAALQRVLTQPGPPATLWASVVTDRLARLTG